MLNRYGIESSSLSLGDLKDRTHRRLASAPGISGNGGSKASTKLKAFICGPARADARSFNTISRA